MWDLITAILGGKHCAWCVSKPNGRIIRYFDYTGPRSDQSLSRRIFWRFMDWNDKLGIWEIAMKWHYRFHERKGGPEKWR